MTKLRRQIKKDKPLQIKALRSGLPFGSPFAILKLKLIIISIMHTRVKRGIYHLIYVRCVT